jgi:hypothetical protein
MDQSVIDFIELINTDILPRLRKMLENEITHQAGLLRAQKKRDTPIIRHFLSNSQTVINQLKYNIQEYETYVEINSIP